MSTRKFRRLFIVSFVPLLILGVITAQLLFHYSGGRYEYILCDSFLGIDNCRPVGDPDGNLYKHVEGEYPAWFSVYGLDDRSAPLYNFIMASTRVVPGVQIVHASPFVGFGPEVASFMGSFAGMRAVVKLGIEKGERSIIISDEDIILYCNDLSFKAMEGEYTSRCYGKGWAGNVTYRATGVSRDELDKLLASINKTVDSRSRDYNIYRAVMYPIYVYLFLLVSFFAWVFLKAVRFVKNG